MTPMERSVLRAYEAGERSVDTARQLGVSRQRVTELRSALRRRGFIKASEKATVASSAGTIRIRLSLAAFTEIEKAAGKRGLTPSAMIRRLIETIAADRMFDAVLDDAE